MEFQASYCYGYKTSWHPDLHGLLWTGSFRIGLHKIKFLYSVVSNPQDCWKRFTLYSVQSNTISASLGSIQPRWNQFMKTIRAQIFTTAYSQVLIHTAQDSNSGPLSREFDDLPMSHALRYYKRWVSVTWRVYHGTVMGPLFTVFPILHQRSTKT